MTGGDGMGAEGGIEAGRSRSKVRSAIGGWWGLVFLVIFVSGSSLFILNSQMLDDFLGASARALSFQVLTVLTLLLFYGWLLLSPWFSRPIKYGVSAIGALTLAGLYFSIRRVGFTGHNDLVIEWVWSERNTDRLAKAGRLITEGTTLELDPSMAEGASSPTFLGPNRDGQVPPPSDESWLKQVPREVWRFPIGGGYAGFSAQGNIAVTIEQQGSLEVTSAYDVRSGSPLWRYTHESMFSETMGGDGPRATPTIAEGRVLSLGANGHLVCLELLTGKERWSHNILKDSGVKNIFWGMSASPLVLDGKVIVHPGNGLSEGHGKPLADDETRTVGTEALAAYSLETGERLWGHGRHKAAYSSPVAAMIDGVKQIVIFDGEGLAGHEFESGRELWRFEFPTMNSINVAQPILLPDGRAFISAHYGSGSAMVKVLKDGEAWRATEEWKSKNLKCKFTSPVLIEGYLYGLDDGIMVCIDPSTGKRKWKKGRYGNGQILAAGRGIIVMAEDGRVVLVEATPEQLVETAQWQALPPKKNWNAPTLVGNRLLVRNHFEMACYEWPGESNAGLTQKENANAKVDR